jgi:DNA-binding MarR family transcriptional regulator
MSRPLRNADYRALAEFRYQIRRFLNRSDQACRAAGLEPQQYQLLLAVRGLPEGKTATIGTLAERLQLRHHSAVELTDRLVSRGYACRARNAADRRQVLISLTERGHKILQALGRQRLAELRRSGPALVQALDVLIARTPRSSRRLSARVKLRPVPSSRSNSRT